MKSFFIIVLLSLFSIACSDSEKKTATPVDSPSKTASPTPPPPADSPIVCNAKIDQLAQCVEREFNKFSCDNIGELNGDRVAQYCKTLYPTKTCNSENDNNRFIEKLKDMTGRFLKRCI